MRKLGIYLALMAALLAPPAYAYIGPGVGAGTVAVVFGVIASIILAFVAIIWYPFKRLFRGRKASATESAKTNRTSDELDTDNDSLHRLGRVHGSHSSRDGDLGD